MSYEKQNWATGDIITADKLNHMEDGIAGADNSIYVLDMDNLQVPVADGESSEGIVTVRHDGSELRLENCYIADIPNTAKVFILSDPTEGYVLVGSYGVAEVFGYSGQAGTTFCLADNSCVVWSLEAPNGDNMYLFPSTATFAWLDIGQ